MRKNFMVLINEEGGMNILNFSETDLITLLNMKSCSKILGNITEYSIPIVSEMEVGEYFETGNGIVIRMKDKDG